MAPRRTLSFLLAFALLLWPIMADAAHRAMLAEANAPAAMDHASMDHSQMNHGMADMDSAPNCATCEDCAKCVSALPAVLAGPLPRLPHEMPAAPPLPAALPHSPDLTPEPPRA